MENTSKAVDTKAVEVVAELNPRTVARNKAFEVIKELVDKQTDAKYKEAMAIIRPSAYGMTGGGGSGQPSIASRFVAHIVEKKKAHEDAIFKEFKVGRKDCAQFIRRELKMVEPAKRAWINFDGKTGEYTLMGTGAKPPVGWAGYVPVEGQVDLAKAGLK